MTAVSSLLLSKLYRLISLAQSELLFSIGQKSVVATSIWRLNMTQEIGHSFILCRSWYLMNHQLSREATHDIILKQMINPLTEFFACMYLQRDFFLFFCILSLQVLLKFVWYLGVKNFIFEKNYLIVGHIYWVYLTN